MLWLGGRDRAKEAGKAEEEMERIELVAQLGVGVGVAVRGIDSLAAACAVPRVSAWAASTAACSTADARIRCSGRPKVWCRLLRNRAVCYRELRRPSFSIARLLLLKSVSWDIAMEKPQTT